MANVRKKISELTALTSASLDTVIVGVDNGGLKNKESIFSILNAHMIYYRKMYNTVNEKSKDNGKNENNKKASFLTQRREIL